MIRLRLLGYPAVDGVTHRHRLGALALLAMAPGRALSREKLIAFLWPEAEAAQGRNLLNVCVHGLRKAAGPDVPQSQGESLLLPNALVTVDALEFQSALGAGQQERAVGLYRAPFLDGFFLSESTEFDQWAARERARLAALHEEGLEALARAAGERGDDDGAVRWWRTLTSADPFSTRATIGLMEALERAGQRGIAIQRAQEHEELLRRELDATPDPEFSALMRRMRREPNGRAHAAATNGGPTPPPDVAPDAANASTDRVSGSTAVAPAGRTAPRDVRPTRRGSRRFAAGLVVGAAVVVLVVIAPDVGTPGLIANRVVVSHFENRTGDPALDAAGFMAADWITKGVMSLGLGEVVSSDEGLQSTIWLRADTSEGKTSGMARRLARETRSRLVVSGSYYLRGDTIAFQAGVMDGGSARVLRAIDEVRAPIAQISAAVSTVRDRVVGALATQLDERMVSWSEHAGHPPSLAAYRQYAAGMDLFMEGTTVDFQQRLKILKVANDHFLAAASYDSTFVAPLIWIYISSLRTGVSADSVLERLRKGLPRMAPWDNAMARHVLSAASGDRAAALQAAREVARYSPDSEWLLRLAESAFGANRMGEAAAALARIVPTRGWMRRWPGYWGLKARLHHQLGDYATERSAVDRLRQDHPRLVTQPTFEFSWVAATGGEYARLRDLAREFMAKERNSNPTWMVWELRLHGRDLEATALAKDLAGWSLARVDSGGARPNTPSRHISAIRILTEAKRFEEAAGLLRSWAVASAGDTVLSSARLRYEFLLLRGNLAARQGRRDVVDSVFHAMGETEKSLQPGDSSTILHNRAVLHAELGEFEAALDLARASISRYGNNSTYGHGTALSVLARRYKPYHELMRPVE